MKKANNWIRGIVFFIVCLFLGGCSGRNIHPDLAEDKNVLVRQWTRPSAAKWDRLVDSTIHGNDFSSPILVGNTLLLGNTTEGLVAIYPSLNLTRWTFPIASGGVMSNLLENNGNIYFGGGDGFLYSIKLENGRLNWKYETRTHLISQPAIKDGRLFFTTSDDTVVALDAGSGEWLWHFRRNSNLSATIHRVAPPIHANGQVLAGLSDGYLVALNPETGKIKWEKKLHDGKKFIDVDAEPILENNIVYLPSYDGALFALDAQDGKTIWKYDAGGARSIVLSGNYIYLSSSDGNLYCMNRESSKVNWKFELDSGVPSQVAIGSGLVLVASTYQYLYALKEETGAPVFRFNAGFGAGFYSDPLYDPERKLFYAMSSMGNLYAFKPRESKRKQFLSKVTDGYAF